MAKKKLSDETKKILLINSNAIYIGKKARLDWY